MARKSKQEDDEIWSEDEEQEAEECDDSGSDYEEPKKAPKKKTTSATKKKPTNSGSKKKQKTASSSSNTSMTVNSEYMEDIKQIFNKFEKDNSGKMETNQLKFAMRALGFEPKNEEVKRISESYDKNGFIEYQDFVDLLVKRFTEKNVSEEIMKAFQLFDKDQKGKITLADLQRVSDELGEKISMDELNEMIDEADLNGDSAIDAQEFLRIMKKTSLY